MTAHLRSAPGWTLVFLCLALLAPAAPLSAGLLPSFSKDFEPKTIGPGSTSTLRFDLGNPDPDNPVSDLAFEDVLPASVVIADPAQAFTDCDGALLSAPAGGSTITFSDGGLGPDTSCSVTVDVASATPGVHMNVSGDLTHSAGNSGPAIADLTVDATLPGFTKAFSPNPAIVGNTSTLTFTIDDTLNAGGRFFLSFNDVLPSGLLVANPANATSDCTGFGQTPSITAVPGSGTISFFNGGLDGNSSCTVSVDVVAEQPGPKGNTSDILSYSGGSAGKASATLEVTQPFLRKLFTDDPVPPGATATLEFTLTNLDRNESATDISFADDLSAVLAGLQATGLPLADPCGSGSQLTGPSLLILTGGDLPPGGDCTFSVSLSVPAETAPGTYVNTTSSVSFERGGNPELEDPASDDLVVSPVPILTKSFTDDPVTAGDTVILSFTVTNTSPDFTASEIFFEDPLPEILPTDVSVPGADPCGTGSSVTFQDLINPPPPSNAIPAMITLTEGELGPGESCNFDVVLNVLDSATSGSYLNTTSAITAVVDETPVQGSPATDLLAVVDAPRLVKEFTDDPVLPGNTVTLEFTLDLGEEAPGGATDIGFTDDLSAVVAGLEAVGLPINDVCGEGSQLSGTDLLTFTGGNLSPGGSCTFSATLTVPPDLLPGSLTNTTSEVSATSLGLPVSSVAATAELVIGGLTFTKEFTDDPVLAGDTVTLEFFLENLSSVADATGMIFTDDLDDTLDGLVAQGLPIADPCGPDSDLIGLSGDTFLQFTGGFLAAGTSCSFAVTLQVSRETRSPAITPTRRARSLPPSAAQR